MPYRRTNRRNLHDYSQLKLIIIGIQGVETAAEIYDMLNEDVLNYVSLKQVIKRGYRLTVIPLQFPRVLREQARVSIIQSRDHILNTYSEKISQYAEKKFARDGTDLILNARVKEITPDKVIYTTKSEDGSVEEHSVITGFTL